SGAGPRQADAREPGRTSATMRRLVVPLLRGPLTTEPKLRIGLASGSIEVPRRVMLTAACSDKTGRLGARSTWIGDNPSVAVSDGDVLLAAAVRSELGAHGHDLRLPQALVGGVRGSTATSTGSMSGEREQAEPANEASTAAHDDSR